MENKISGIVPTNPAEAFFAYHSTITIPTKTIIRSSKYCCWIAIRRDAIKNHQGHPGTLGQQKWPTCYSPWKSSPPILFGTRHLRLGDQWWSKHVQTGRTLRTLCQISLSVTWLHKPLWCHSCAGTSFQLLVGVQEPQQSLTSIPSPTAQKPRETKMAKPKESTALLSVYSYYNRIMCNTHTFLLLRVCRILNQHWSRRLHFRLGNILKHLPTGTAKQILTSQTRGQLPKHFKGFIML